MSLAGVVAAAALPEAVEVVAEPVAGAPPPVGPGGTGTPAGGMPAGGMPPYGGGGHANEYAGGGACVPGGR